jgi:hypothetical protein
VAPARPPGKRHFHNAGLLVDRRGDAELYAGLNKGGVFKFFRDNRLAHSDTGISLRMNDGRVAVAHLVGGCRHEVGDGGVTVSGEFGWAKQKGMTPFRLVALRALMLTVGRFDPDRVRRLLQKMLIVGKQAAPFRFERRFRWDGENLVVEDKVEAADWSGVESAGIGGFQTSIYVVMSRTFQAGQLQGWHDLTADVRRLRPGEPLVLARRF